MYFIVQKSRWYAAYVVIFQEPVQHHPVLRRAGHTSTPRVRHIGSWSAQNRNDAAQKPSGSADSE